MIWSVEQIIAHLSREGTTLKAGTVIMTGTPSGVGGVYGAQGVREKRGFGRGG